MGFPRQDYWSGLLLQGIFLTQRLNLYLLHWQVDSLPLSHLGSPLSRVGREEEGETKGYKQKPTTSFAHLIIETVKCLSLPLLIVIFHLNVCRISL